MLFRSPLLKTPLATVLHSAATGTLATLEPLVWSDGAAVTVVLAAAGYPDKPRGGCWRAATNDPTSARW